MTQRRRFFVVVMTLITLMAFGLGNTLSVSAQAAPNPNCWTLNWADEFDGTEIDRDNWTFDIGGSGWGNNELEYYTDRPENARIEDGILVIEAREEEYGSSDYTSARLLTQGLQTWQYGRFEARLKLPFGQGIWPAFWMLGADITSVGWPNSGEIDIMEFIGREPSNVYGTLHGPGYSGGSSIGGSLSLVESAFSDEFHTFAVEWLPDRISWYVDGKQYLTKTAEDLPGEWVFDHDFFILLNLAVGGNWPGYPDETTTFPQQYLVDYVRVYDMNLDADADACSPIFQPPSVVVEGDLALEGDNLAPNGIPRETYYAPFPVNITLDGQFGDWEDVPRVTVPANADLKTSDPAVTFAAAADATHLYVMFDVIDDNIISGQHADSYWNEDSVEFYLNATGDLELTSYADGVAQVTIPPLNIGLSGADLIIAGINGAGTGANTVVIKTATGYAVEISVPLVNDVWTITPENDGRIGFQVHLNSATTADRNGKFIWSVFDNSDQSYQNPSLFGELIFYAVPQE